MILLELRGPLLRPISKRLCTIFRTLENSAKCVVACTNALSGLDANAKANQADLVTIYLNRAWAFLQRWSHVVACVGQLNLFFNSQKYDVALSDIGRANEVNSAGSNFSCPCGFDCIDL